MTNQILNKIVNDINDIIHVDCAIWTEKGEVSAYTSDICLQDNDAVKKFLSKIEEYELLIEDKKSFFLVKEEEEAYVIVLYTGGEQAKVYGRLCVSQVQNLIKAYKTRTDKNHFYQNLLLDNFLMVDIFNQAKKLGIENEDYRVVFIIEPKNQDDELVIETMKSLYVTGTKDYVTSVSEGHIIYIKNVEKIATYVELNAVAKNIVATMNTEAMVNVRVSYGTIVNQLKDVSKSYKEATLALDVGKVFYAEKSVLAYNELGIGRLIHQLPYNLCEMFLEEVFDGREIEKFDDETLNTINQLFANNLNISETARQLYIHRNTLVYRLEKIQKITGLNVLVFEDALTFKIAMMVAHHMKKGID